MLGVCRSSKDLAEVWLSKGSFLDLGFVFCCTRAEVRRVGFGGGSGVSSGASVADPGMCVRYPSSSDPTMSDGTRGSRKKPQEFTRSLALTMGEGETALSYLTKPERGDSCRRLVTAQLDYVLDCRGGGSFGFLIGCFRQYGGSRCADVTLSSVLPS